MTNEVINFKKYDTGRKGSYELKNEDSIWEFLNCPFDGTSIISNWEYGDFFCPNCRINYKRTGSQENLDGQKAEIIDNIREEVKRAEKTKKKLRVLEKLVKNPMVQTK